MRLLDIRNPFGAPVFHEETVSSTMDVSRMLALQGQPHGTVITADFQEAGRGRVKGRKWDMERECSLSFTLLLRFPRPEDFPAAITLRAGLATALAIEDFAPSLSNTVMIKWPNDILLPFAGSFRKAAGILCEAEGGNVHIGAGINVGQKSFPGVLREKAASVGQAAGMEISPGGRFSLLEKMLRRLFDIFGPADPGGGGPGWKKGVEERLYKKGEKVSFAEGAADSGRIVTGTLSGIGPGGELLLYGAALRSFTAGELLINY